MDIECTVCLESFNESQIMVGTPCGHIFHKHCLSAWFNSNRELQFPCPQCRFRCKKAWTKRIFLNFSKSQHTACVESELLSSQTQLKDKEKELNHTLAKLNKMHKKVLFMENLIQDNHRKYLSIEAEYKKELKKIKNYDTLKEKFKLLLKGLKRHHHLCMMAGVCAGIIVACNISSPRTLPITSFILSRPSSGTILPHDILKFVRY